jgi:hypothetical protein
VRRLQAFCCNPKVTPARIVSGPTLLAGICFWGARKIRELLVRRLDGDVRIPVKSTIHAVLDRHGLVRRGGVPRTVRAARRCPLMPDPMICGAPTSRASSSSAMAAIVIR